MMQRQQAHSSGRGTA